MPWLDLSSIQKLIRQEPQEKKNLNFRVQHLVSWFGCTSNQLNFDWPDVVPCLFHTWGIIIAILFTSCSLLVRNLHFRVDLILSDIKRQSLLVLVGQVLYVLAWYCFKLCSVLSSLLFRWCRGNASVAAFAKSKCLPWLFRYEAAELTLKWMSVIAAGRNCTFTYRWHVNKSCVLV